jgi:urea carboxylase
VFRKVLIANRGEIAVRIIRTLRRLGIGSVVVHSQADRFTRPVLEADAAVLIGAASAEESYLDPDAIIGACLKTGAEAVHPGYGFLSENAEFAEKLAERGITFIGPRPEHLRDFGLKHRAREIAARSGVPLLPGSGLLVSVADAIAAAEAVGYPVMLKGTAGGGGIGMRQCRDAAELAAAFEPAQRMARTSFGDERLYLERFVTVARHLEVQIFGDGRGNVVALGERDCSLQRRNQKVVEETPAPNLPENDRRRLHEAATALASAVAYESAGTVEFIYDIARQEFSFLEVNTRLQVEHPVTEAVFGIDLVEWMIRQAAGGFELPAAPAATGAAMEARLYAENPQADFRPVSGLLTHVSFPEDARIDTWVETGTEVTPFYDPLLAKVIVAGGTREEALAKLRSALGKTAIYGLETNLDYLRAIIAAPQFARGEISTNLFAAFSFESRAIEAIAPGAQTSVQDWPGRIGLWDVGVPPSGPMDDRSHRLANRIVGNDEGDAALECTLAGPTLRFHCDAVIALTGAPMIAKLDGKPVAFFRPVAIKAGQMLALGAIAGPGMRTYLAVRGSIDAPLFLGARACFDLGRFGGHATGTLRAGDVLKIAERAQRPPRPAASDEIPELTREWTITVRSGPQGAPDFFTEGDIAALLGSRYEVHFNSARTGVRLIGPQPDWARSDGGEAGLHPSNIHDNAYAMGSLDFTGDMPIILGPDGPSLGGFVCPAVIASHDLWKMGQLKPGDRVRFLAEDGYSVGRRRGGKLQSPILWTDERGTIPVVYRRAGDDCLLVEYGPMALDIAVRLRVHLLAEAVRGARPKGLIDLTPGIRSLQIHFDSQVLPGIRVFELLREIESGLPAAEDATVASRAVHLPLSWNDRSVQLAVRKYHELVRPDAPWCPDNIEFIRRINGLPSIEDVRAIVFDADYLVLGLGDVYLGAPVATPLDPRHRLVTTKYNPARTWTPENAVGIGGAYLCVYGMEGPGGYQLFGRTIQMWNSWRTTDDFTPGRPWLLRFFDRIKFYPVDEQELAEAREAFPHGRYPIRIEETSFSYREHARFLADNAGVGSFKATQQAAFAAERADWMAKGVDSFVSDEGAATADEEALPEGMSAVPATMTGKVWKVVVEQGSLVEAGQPVVIVESMKMEMPIATPFTGRIAAIRCRMGQLVRVGDTLAIVERAP